MIYSYNWFRFWACINVVQLPHPTSRPCMLALMKMACSFGRATTFLEYISVHTGVHFNVSLSWSMHNKHISGMPLIWGVKMLHKAIIPLNKYFSTCRLWGTRISNYHWHITEHIFLVIPHFLIRDCIPEINLATSDHYAMCCSIGGAVAETKICCCLLYTCFSDARQHLNWIITLIKWCIICGKLSQSCKQ